MLPAIRLIDFGMRQVVGLVPDAKAREALAKMTGPAIQLVVKHFTDHSQTLPKALAQANDRAWQAVSIALAGDGFLDQIKLFFASADDKGIREQVRLFLQDKSIGYDGTPADFRKKCLTELNLARNARLLTLSPNDVAQHAANFQRYADPKGHGGRCRAGHRAYRRRVCFILSEPGEVAAATSIRWTAAARRRPSRFSSVVQSKPTANWLVACFSMACGNCRQPRTKPLMRLAKALNSLGDQFEQVFEQLGPHRKCRHGNTTVVVETQEAVLDMQAELQRLARCDVFVVLYKKC